MRPLELKIKGLHSFTSEETIDFEKLTKYGFFGIFGPTGSGKSTILDAITLSLFGKISRLDGKSKNQFININENTAYVSFKFSILKNGKYKIYVAERKYKRVGDSSQVSGAKLYEIENNENKIISDTSTGINNQITKLLGLSYEDFTRTVILPQGKFSQFLLLENKDRSDMLERIFKLDKYGARLSNKINEKRKSKKEKLDLDEEKLNFYGDISEADISLKKEELIKLDNEITLVRNEENNLTKIRSELTQIDKLNTELLSFENKKNELLAEDATIKNLSQKLQMANNAEIVLPYLDNLEISQNEHNKIITEYNEKLKELSTISKAESQLKTQLEKITQEKEEKHPLLTDKKFKLNEAIKLNKEIIPLDKEIKKLQTEYKENSKTKISYESEKENLQLTHKENLSQLEKFELFQKELKIDPQIKQKAQSALVLAEKIIELKNQKDLINENLINTQNKNLKSIENFKELSENTEELLKIINDLEIKHKEINQVIPDPNQIIALKEKYLNNKNTYTLKLELEEKIQKNLKNQDLLNNNLDTLNNKFSSLSKNLKDTEIQLNSKKELLENIKRENLIETLTAELNEGDPCPLCGNPYHDSPHITKNEDSEILKESIQVLELKLEDESKKLKKLELEKNSIQINLENLNKELEKQQEEIKNYDLSSKEALDKLDEEINNLSKQNEIFTKEKDLVLEKLDKSKKDLSTKESSIAALNENIKNSEELIKKYSLEEKEKSDLLKEQETQLEQLAKFLKLKNDYLEIENFNKEIYDKETKREKLTEEESKKRKENESLYKQIENLNKNISELQLKIKGLTIEGKEKREQIDNYKEKIKSFTDSDNPEKELELTQKLLLELENKEKEISVSYKNISDKLSKAKNETLILETKIKESQNSINLNTKNLELNIIKYGFNNKDQIKENLISNKDELKQKIEYHNENYKTTIDNINRLYKELQNKDTNDLKEHLLNTENQLSEINSKLENLIKTSALLREEISKSEENLKLVIELKNEIQKNTKELDLLSELSSLCSGNRFVQFVAAKELKYITLEASKRLKSISRGKYGLELDGTSFVIRDDFNGGIRRVPKTLSGGEIFMTSLCLSLALSSKIQLNHKNPLEFFFLDEGFGTLDSNALDDVITSLESLRNEKISIGIITHWEDIKDRIPVKLIVTPAKQFEHGTKTKIE